MMVALGEGGRPHCPPYAVGLAWLSTRCKRLKALFIFKTKGLVLKQHGYKWLQTVADIQEGQTATPTSIELAAKKYY